MRSGHVAVTLIITLVVTLTSCAPSPKSTATTGAGEAPPAAAPKRIVAAVRGDPRTLSDAVNFASGGSSSAGVAEIEQLLNAGLATVDLQGNLLPQLAEAAPTLDNGLWQLLPDGRMETTWKIRAAALWHDGHPVSSQDLVFATTVYQDKSQPIYQDEPFKYLESVQAPDPQTFVATWRSAFVDADKLFTMTAYQNRDLILPAHLLEPAYAQDKATFTGSPYFGSAYVGTGPFKLKEWVLGSHLILDANERYVLGRPKVDQIEVKFILDTNTMVANLIAQALDLTLGRGLTPEQAIEVRNKWTDGKVDAGLQNTTSLYPNLMDPDPSVLADVRFRRALLLALDRQQLVDDLLGGFVPVADSIFSPDDPEYAELLPSMVRYPHDPRLAMATLDQMGLSKGRDGSYIDGSGKKLSIEVRTRSHPTREKVQQVIADAWAQIGLVGEPVVIPEQRISDRVYQATFPGFYFRFGGPTQLVQWQSKAAPTAQNNYVGNNSMRYQNPVYDALVDRLLVTIPRAERMQVMADLVHLETDQLLLLTLYHEPEPVLISNRLVNVGGRRGLAVQAWNAAQWDVKS